MAKNRQKLNEGFDFSLEAGDFKERLWREIRATQTASQIQALEDDDLIWVNAAGVPHPAPCEDEKI